MNRKILMVGLFFALTIFGLSGCTNTVTEIEYVDREVEVPVYVNVDIPDTFNEVLGELIENHYSAPMIDELWEGALNGMIDTLDDPFTSYFDYEEYAQYNQSFGESYVGIGVSVQFSNGNIIVQEVKSNSPALSSGMQVNDLIVEVDGESITDINFYEVINKIIGDAGTDVTVGVIRSGFNEVIQITMTRAKIDNPSVVSNYYYDNGQLIGYIKVNTFGDETAANFASAITGLEVAGIDGLIIDLRNNGGGHVTAVYYMLQEFLLDNDKQMFVTEGLYNGSLERIEYFGIRSAKKDYEIITLVNEGSASASEVFASAMQEHGGYPVIGTVTYGKGTMQQTKVLETTIVLDENGDFLSADRLHITIGKWKTADENWVHGIGVTPDVLVDRSDTEKAFKTFIGDETIMYDVVDMRVANIQLILNTMGYSVRTDGYFDVVTKDAILDIQNENGLTETGNIDSDTLVVINNALGDYLNDDANDSMLQASIDYFSE